MGRVVHWRLGLDEAGRGPLLGPLAVGCFGVPTADVGELVSIGAADSKTLGPHRRAAVAAALREFADERGWWHEVVLVQPDAIDAGMQAGSLNEVELEQFAARLRRALKVLPEEDHGSIGVDAFDPDPERLARRLEERIAPWSVHRWRVEAAHRADAHDPVVGAASILAKVDRDAAIAALTEELGLDLGSGYPADERSRAALQHLVTDAEAPHTALRWGWAPVIKAFRARHDRPPPLRVTDAPLPGGQRRLF